MVFMTVWSRPYGVRFLRVYSYYTPSHSARPSIDQYCRATSWCNDKKGRENLCKYILRPPLANDRLKILDGGDVRLELKRPWSDGTSSVDLAPLALIARLAAIVPPPRRHVVRYSGVISSHSSLRSQVVPVPAVAAPEEKDTPSPPLSHYISWSQLLKRTFGIDTVCPRCKSPLHLIAMIETEGTIKKILKAMGLPTEAPRHPKRAYRAAWKSKPRPWR